MPVANNAIALEDGALGAITSEGSELGAIATRIFLLWNAFRSELALMPVRIDWRDRANLIEPIYFL